MTVNYFGFDVMLNVYTSPIKSIKSQLPITDTITTFISVAFNLVCDLVTPAQVEKVLQADQEGILKFQVHSHKYEINFNGRILTSL